MKLSDSELNLSDSESEVDGEVVEKKKMMKLKALKKRKYPIRYLMR